MRSAASLALSTSLTLAALLALVGLSGCSSAPPSAPSLRAVSALLVRHAQDVRRHDATAFTADIYSGASARGFRTQQRAAFANLTKLPLSHWSYVIDSRTDDRQAEQAASNKYGRPAVIVHLSLRYAFRGIDTRPTSHDLWWTFVTVGGQVRIAGDGDLADAGGQSWQGPWDFGPLTVLADGPVLVIGHTASTNPATVASAITTLQDIETTARAAVPAVTAVWGERWPQRVAVLVPASESEFDAQVGPSSEATTSEAALAVADGQDPLTGQAYGQRLIVNPAAFATLSAVGRQIVIRHEVTHIATADATGQLTPRWVVEGFADYVGNRGSGQPVTEAAAQLRVLVRTDHVPTALPTEAQFDDTTTAAIAYEGAWLACRLIAAKAGQDGLVRFYRLAGVVNAGTDDPNDLLAGTFRAVLHETTAQFTAQWRTYLEAQLR